MAPRFDLPFKLRERHGKRKRDTIKQSQSDPSAHDEGSSEDDAGFIRQRHFPHAPSKSEPAFPIPNRSVSQRNIKTQHLAALNGVLHRSILEGDYARASRALELLTKVEFQGRRCDLRRNGWWGIKGELLLHHDTLGSVNGEPATSRGVSSSTQNTSQDGSQPRFSEQGLQNAKNYYERLIVQYPYRRQRAKDVSEIEFYPAMIDIWILLLQSRLRRCLEKNPSSKSSRNSANATSSKASVTNNDYDDQRRGHSSGSRTVPQDGQRELNLTIQEIEELHERLQGLLLRDPFDRDRDMLGTHGMVSLWLADVYTDTGRLENRAQSLREQATASFSRQKQLQDRKTFGRS